LWLFICFNLGGGERYTKKAAAETILLVGVDARSTSAEANSALDLAVKQDWADAFSEHTHPPAQMWTVSWCGGGWPRSVF